MGWVNLNIREKIQLTGICLFLLTLPYNREINQLFLVLFLLSSAPCINRSSWQRNKKAIFIFTAIFGIVLLSCLYDPDLTLALKKVEIKLALLLVPFIFGASYTPSNYKNDAIWIAFITGVCSALLYLLVYFIIHMRGLHLPVSQWLKQQYLNHQYSKPIDIHAGFFSCYVSLCLFALISFLFKKSDRFIRTGILLLMALCLISLFLLTSRSVLILTFGCLLCFTPFVLKRVSWYASATFGLAAAGLIYFFMTRSNYFEERFTGELNKDVKLSQLTHAVEDHSNDLKGSILKNDGTRIERWVASMELIKKRPLLGYGAGQEKPQLWKKYEELGLTVSLEQHYDSHNQFISYTITSGILGLIAFVVLLVFAFIHAFRARSFLYITFLILVTGTCLIDTFLEVNKGVFFFAFFNVFLYMTSPVSPKARPAGQEGLLVPFHRP
ncbi:MAG: O-antigen ligase family protein [Chitinophagaceae bacterium]|nr:O-antigen ligase family protein [Chitinophagaceae bacterium]